MKLFSIILTLALSLHLCAQTTISGTIKNKQTGNPISFVNVGVIGESVGTVADENGNFALTISDNYYQHKLRISSIGFQEVNYQTALEAVEYFSKHSIIELSEEATKLEEVEVKIKKRSNKKKNKTSYSIGFKDSELGRELGVLQNSKKSRSIDYIEFDIAKNDNSKSKLRLNIYSLDENGFPLDKIIKQNVYIELAKNETGLMYIDLSSHNIQVKGNYIITFECIKNMKQLMFKAQISGETYLRAVSQDKWISIMPEIKCEVGYK